MFWWSYLVKLKSSCAVGRIVNLKIPLGLQTHITTRGKACLYDLENMVLVSGEACSSGDKLCGLYCFPSIELMAKTLGVQLLHIMQGQSPFSVRFLF